MNTLAWPSAQVRCGRADNGWVVTLEAVWRWLNDDVDPMVHARQRIVGKLSALGALMLAVFGLAGWWDHQYAVAALGGVLTLALGGNAWSLQRQQAPLLPFWALASALVLGSFAALALRGVSALLWSFPVLFVISFSLPRRLAKALAAVLVTGLFAGCALTLERSMALRAGLVMVAMAAMLGTVLECIADLQRALIDQASIDPLTSALNRRQLQPQLDRVRSPAWPSASQHAVLAIDVDNFKHINDRHGHDVGDQVLRRLVDSLRRRARHSDQLFRVGGEEFLLLLPEVTEQVAGGIAESLRLRLAQDELLPGHPVTVSIGVAMLADAGTTQDWIRRADKALYEAKRRGRDRVVMASEVST